MSTSKLQNYVARKLNERFGHLKIYENHYPEWLMGPELESLELDFFIPKLNIAIEVQGSQHYEFNKFFHATYKDFQIQVKRDEVKKTTCYFRGIRLVEVFTEKDADIIISEIYEKEKIKPRCKNIAIDGYSHTNFLRSKKTAEREIKKYLKSKRYKSGLHSDKCTSRVVKILYMSIKYNYEINNEIISSYYECFKKDVDNVLNVKLIKKRDKIEYKKTKGVRKYG